MNTRVAITGIGLVTAVGASRDETWANLVRGVCGIRPLTLFESDGYKSQIAGQAPLERLLPGLTPLQRRRWGRGDQFGVVAAAEAIADAGLDLADLNPARIGVALGAGTADLIRTEHYLQTTIRDGIEHARPSEVWNHFYSTPVDVIASHFHFEGPRTCIVAACASSTMAIGYATDAIRYDRIDAALAGGTDTLTQLTFSGFNALRVMDPSPCRPFDRSRAGMNIGEGAAILVLENYERARRRGARIYAEVAGHGLSCEAFHPTSPEPDGRAIATTMGRALADARVPADEIDHVNAHGTATVHNDRAEARGIRLVLGDRARRVPVTAIKSMVGHSLGAAGGIEAAVTALTIFHGIVPPTIHHADTDPDCDVDVVANEPREVPVRCAISTSLAFGGNDAALVLRAV
jgi:3-oxoacyl-[acyl-carrier-protein] synthase II